MKYEPSGKVIQSYVYHEDKVFFVSTITRSYDIPAAGGEMRGYETMAWDYDEETKERGDIVAHESGREDHFHVCAELLANGKMNEDD